MEILIKFDIKGKLEYLEDGSSKNIFLRIDEILDCENKLTGALRKSIISDIWDELNNSPLVKYVKSIRVSEDGAIHVTIRKEIDKSYVDNLIIHTNFDFSIETLNEIKKILHRLYLDKKVSEDSEIKEISIDNIYMEKSVVNV